MNKKCVKCENCWRAFPILAYAVPGFLDIDAGIKAKLIGIVVDAWISIPTSMLLATVKE